MKSEEVSCSQCISASNCGSASVLLVAEIQDPMPTIVKPADYATWLNPTVADVEALQAPLGPLPERLMEALPVSSTVNSPANAGPSIAGQWTTRAEWSARAPVAINTSTALHYRRCGNQQQHGRRKEKAHTRWAFSDYFRTSSGGGFRQQVPWPVDEL